ncbi:MAG: hypothetical protein HRT67_02955 [Flavobacteriaceae bacterium]|nr:hypothetical protein [Flavobacteriaceae bacterium]
MIGVLLVFYVVAFVLGIKRPTAFVIFYVLASTKFLGFLDPSTFIFSGLELGYFGLNLIALLCAFFSKKWFLVPRVLFAYIFLIVLILLHGILKPVMDYNSSLIQAIMASKEIWYYFLFFYLVVYRDDINDEELFKGIKTIGVYLSLVYVIGYFIPVIRPPLYDNVTYIRTFFPTYISLALFFYAIRLKFSNSRNLYDRVVVVILFLGLFFAAHLSLTIMTLAGFVLYKYVYNIKLNVDRYSVKKFAFVVFVGVCMTIIFFEGFYDAAKLNIDQIISGEDNALSSRDVYNAFRWEVIERSKSFGHGFIHQSSNLMKTVSTVGNNRFMERLTVIDSGYVDMFLKFGYIGTAIILLVMSRYYLLGFVKKHKNPLSLAMSIYLAQYYFINYTWSVYTFAHGIIPGVIALYLLAKNLQSWEVIKSEVRTQQINGI